MNWLSFQELNDVFRMEQDIVISLHSSRKKRTREDWLLIISVKGNHQVSKILPDLWPLLNHEEDSWVWSRDLNARFKTYLEKYPLDLSTKKDQIRIHLLIHHCSSNWMILDRLLPQVPDLVRNEFCCREWNFFSSNNNSASKIDLTDFTTVKNVFEEYLGKGFKSTDELRSVVDIYKGLDRKKESGKGKIVFGVLTRREHDYQKKERLRSYLNADKVPLDKIDEILGSFPLGLYWMNPVKIQKTKNGAYINWNETDPLSSADLLLV